ncbi:MAG TPA: DNA-protecting protein DprA, partial [Blastococcus sp.]|nr:DNA-protecting protein DprA [Blastococcus sp.]
MSLDEDLEEAAAAGGGGVHPGLRRARAWLTRVVEPGTVDFWRYVADVGPVQAVRRLRAGTAPERLRSLVGARAGQDQSSEDLLLAHRCDARLVVPEDDEWPAFPLHALTVAVAGEPTDPQQQADRTIAPVPPVGLWVRGP